jgi:hypothetical protein
MFIFHSVLLHNNYLCLIDSSSGYNMKCVDKTSLSGLGGLKQVEI